LGSGFSLSMGMKVLLPLAHSEFTISEKEVLPCSR
jgi:hypothetical protein